MRSKNLMWAAVAMAVMAAGLLVLAKVTPWYDDYDAYRARENQIEAMPFTAGRQPGGLSAKGEAFFANQQAHRTNKWLYADLGYLLATWSVVAFVVVGITERYGWRVLSQATPRAMTVVPVALLGVLGLGVSIVAEVGHALTRQQVPMWDDNPGRVVVGALAILSVIGPAFLTLTVLPAVLRRRARGALLVLSRRPHWPAALVTLLYMPSLLIGGLLVAFSYRAGGWATSLTGAIWIWLSLNARALWINPRA